MTQPGSGPVPDAEVGVAVATVWRSPDSPRPVDEPATRDLPDVAAWAAAMDAEVRLGLHGRTETQLLMGEPVIVLAERDGWSQVLAPRQPSSADERGYPGWVRSAHLAEPVDRLDGPIAYATGSTSCRVDGMELSLSPGTALWVDGLEEETVTVLLPGRRHGKVPLREVRLSEKEQRAGTEVGPVLDTAQASSACGTSGEAPAGAASTAPVSSTSAGAPKGWCCRATRTTRSRRSTRCRSTRSVRATSTSSPVRARRSTTWAS